MSKSVLKKVIIKINGRKSYLKSLNCGKKYVHNNGTHFTHGKKCDDCGRFIEKGTLEHFMTVGVSTIWMAMHNNKNKSSYKKDAFLLMDRLMDRRYLFSLTKKEAEYFRERTYFVLKQYGINEDDAILTLKSNQ